MMKILYSLLLTFTLSFTATPSMADAGCPDANFWQNLINDTCWDCFFPIRITGSSLGNADIQYNKPAGSGGAVSVGGNGPAFPSSATSDAFCVCADPNGVPEFGFTLGAWFPTNMFEITRMPYCSPSLGGTYLNTNMRLMGGNKNISGENDKGFYQYHYFSYPMMFMLDMLSEPECNPGGYFDFDIMYLSELDPTWNEDELAFFTTPEIAIFANPVAMAACAGDAASASLGYPIDSLYWCAGSWGNLYPFTGNLNVYGSPPRDTALLATRALATMHRRGLAYATVGSGNLCEASFAPMLPKSQYKMNQIYPMAEANGNHWIGQTPFIWGEWRNIPATGEDFLHVLWRWTDCCLR